MTSLTQKRELAARLLRERAARVEEIGTTAIQRALHLHSLLEPESAAYNVAFSTRIVGRCDAAALHRALQALTNRHEMLRTVFVEKDGRLLRRVQNKEVTFSEINAEGWSPSLFEAEIAAAVKQPFDLTRGPLFRTSLWRRDENDHLLLITAHHAVMDGWSLMVLLDELRMIYPAERDGGSVSLPRISVRFGDVVRRQQEWLATGAASEAREYWRSRLGGDLPVLELPSDRPRPPIQRFRGGTIRFQLPAEQLAALREFARAEGVTLYIVLLAAYILLLHLRTGQTDIVVGTPVSGREAQGFERVVGCLINMLAIRVDFQDITEIRQLLRRVGQEVAGALRYQEYPFQHVVEELCPKRNPSIPPVFQTSFVLQSLQHAWDLNDIFEQQALGGIADFGGLQFGSYPVDQQEGQLDLTLEWIETARTLTGICRFDRELFDPATVERFMDHLRMLLSALPVEPCARITDLPRLASYEASSLRQELPYGPQSPVPENSLDRVVDEWARKTPDALAVEFGEERLTYAELVAAANRFALELQRQGCRDETLCAIHLERSLNLIVAVLGVMKAGGGYLPLDPAYPADRIAYMLGDSGAELVISDEVLPVETDARWVRMGDSTGEYVADFLPPVASAEDRLAYVIYTSGSTGKPKGVEVTHRGLNNLIAAQRAAFGLSADARVLQFASTSFDASIFEIALALGVGATLVMASRDELMLGPGLAELLKYRRISAVVMPPSALAAVPEGPFPDLKLVTVAGEVCPFDLAQRWVEQCQFWNLYGPTEATVWSTAEKCSPNEKPTIGRPILNTAIHLLDDQGNPVSIGRVGELYIGGAGIARGYRGRPDLTNERFVSIGGARLYRSGDLGRWRNDGKIEYLGRHDQQVKVRGYRIELEEIEAALRESAGVQEAAVTVWKGGLAAYVVVSPVAPPTESILDALRKKLPGFMVPNSVTVLKTIPLTLSGKVDRSALPAPEADSKGGMPSTPIEATLVACFSEVLGVAQYGINDDFFEHGGHSLLAVQLLSRLRDAVEQELPLRALFEHPTPVALAGYLAESKGESPLPPIKPAPTSAAPVVSFAQERLWFLNELDSGDASFNIPTVLRISGNLDIARLEMTLQSIVRRHEGLRSSFKSVEGRAVVTIKEDCEIELPVIEAGSEEALRRLAESEALRPFDLAKAPLLRAVLVRESEWLHVLLLTMHHIISDGWSIGVILKELGAIYQGVELPPLPVQYSDYARWQRAWLGDEHVARQLEYWREQLRELQTPALLPHRIRMANPSPRAGVAPLQLSQASVERARIIGRQQKATLFTTLLAGFQALLARYMGEEDIVCGTPVAGRNHTETEAMVGFFVNMLVLRTSLSGQPSVRELIDRVNSVVVGALGNQDVPFEVLVDHLHPQRDLSRTPLFQITFAVHNVPLTIPDIPGLDLEPLEGTTRTTRYEIEAHLWEREGAVDGFLLYRPDLFDEGFIRGLAENYTRLLDLASTRPDEPLNRLDWLSAEERRRLLFIGNGEIELPVASTRCLHEIFESQAKDRPESIAVIDDREALTYRELDNYANRLGHFLRSLGVAQGARVGILLDRSVSLIGAVLAVLKCGGTYVPIDPSYPSDRIGFIAEDSGIGVMITGANYVDRMPDSLSAIIDIDSDYAELMRLPATALDMEVDPHSIAYVIYTSGSTGQPKGVQVAHSHVGRIFESTKEWFGFDEADVWTMFHSAAFDFSVWEIWGALLHGGRLVVVSYATSRAPDAFRELLTSHRVTVLNQTPSAFHQLQQVVLSQLDGDYALRLVIFGGEALELSRLRPWFDRFGDRHPQLVNMYGITETTIHVTYRPLTIADCGCRSSVIGKPLPDLRVYVLDENRMLVPTGVPGELYVGGAGVSSGYLNRPELNAARFIASPFIAGERLYRSGDAACWSASGELEYLGRLDQQVQLHGFRIELGEIESALIGTGMVSAAAITLRDERILAWVVPSSDSGINVTELRIALTARLPEYMVPSWFEPVPTLPMTSNGKIAWNALPEPSYDRALLESEYAAPRTEAENILAGIWSDVLGIGRPGIHDNFFELGGDSILSIQVVARAGQAGLKLSPRQVFQYQTIAQLAAVAQHSDAGDAVPQGPVSGPVPLTPILRWFIAQGLQDAHHWNQSVVLDMRRAVDPAVLESAAGQLLRHHDALRMRLRDGAAVLDTPDEQAVFSVHDADHYDEVACRLQSSLDLVNGPIVRFALFKSRDSTRPDRLLLIAHHIGIDGVSWRILLEDLAILCNGRELPRKTESYLTWAGLVSGRGDYPVPRGDELNLESDLETVTVNLGTEATSALLITFPLAAGMRPEEALISVLRDVLGSALINVESHGRNLVDIDVSRTVGWFTHFDFQAAEAPECSFNYLGQFDQAVPEDAPFSLSMVSPGPERSPRARRAHRLDIGAAVFNKSLRVDWHYSRRLDRRVEIERLAAGFIDRLQALLDRFLAGWPEGTREVYQLAPQQQGMLLESLADRESGVHVEQLTCLLVGPLDVERFHFAWQSVVDRHPILRSRFSWEHRSHPLQLVMDQAELPFETGTWEQDEPAEYLARERLKGFALDQAPLMRIGLFRVAQDRHRLVWTQHHSILDGWSQPLVLGDVIRCYRDGPDPRPAPPYRRYIQWLYQQDFGAAESFWIEHLKGFRRATGIGVQSENPGSGIGYGTVESHIPASVTHKLEALAHAQRVTLGSVVLGVWALLLGEYSGDDDVLFGMTVSGRSDTLDRAGEIVGLLANTLPLRVGLEATQPFWVWVQSVQQKQAELRVWEATPGRVLRAASEVAGAEPLHESIMAFENYPVDRISDGLDFSIQKIGFDGARTNQLIAILATPGEQLHLKFVFDLDRLNPGAIPEHFSTVLTAVADSDGETSCRQLLEGVKGNHPVRYSREFRLPEGRPAVMDPLQRRLAALWADLLGVKEISPNDNFFDLGGHSLLAFELVSRLHSEFGYAASVSTLVEAPTVALLAERLTCGQAGAPSSMVTLTSGEENQTPLILVPGAGGNVLYFHPLAHYLGKKHPLWAIPASGLAANEPIHQSVEEVAAYNVSVLQKVKPHGPYWLGGHSFGCMVALEMAQQLIAKGESVPCLFVLDDMAPIPGRIPPNYLQNDDDGIWLYKILRLAARLQNTVLNLDPAAMQGLTSEEQLDLAMQQLQAIGYFPPGADRDMTHRYVQMFKTNFRASFHYQFNSRYQGKIILFRAGDPKPDDPILAYSREFLADPAWGWHVIADDVDVRMVPGDHISMMADPHVRTLAAELGKVLVE